MALILGTGFVCNGQELGVSFYSSLSWNPNEGIYLSSQVNIELDFNFINTGTTIKFKKNTPYEFSLDFQWYERPLRLSGELVFAPDVFDQGRLEVRYWEDPWNVRLRGTVAAEETPFLELEGTYEERFEVEWYFALSSSLAFHELKLTFALPLEDEGTLSLATRYKDEEEPRLILKWRGTTPWGELRLEFRDLEFCAAELFREWTIEQWEHEFDLLVDAEETLTVELIQKSVFHWSEESGYGFSAKLKQTSSLELARLHSFIFGPGWELRLKLMARELYFQGEVAISEETFLGGGLDIGMEDWEGGIWIEGVLGGEWEWSLGCDWTNGALDELSLELYFET